MDPDLDRLTAAVAGQYAIDREVGRGGMAVVYLARDLKHDRPVAIKVLLPEVAASVGSERFLREIEIAARLNHPHILTLIDSGTADGFLYYVMPYVEDETLRRRLNREGQLPVDEAVQIAREVADGLAYAHGQGLIHRDIKPGNILLSQGHAMLADFGIARAVTEAGGERVTRTGVTVGSPVYMSPEQAAGDERVDGRSDVYALACVLYEMLAGEPPFAGRTPAAIMARKSLDTAPSLRAMRSTAPEHVQAAVEKALSRAPADRFPDAKSFAEALSAANGIGMPRRASDRGRVPGRRAAGVAIAVGIAATAWFVLRPSSTPPAVESNTVAIFPFPVTAPDTVLDWLGKGMPHLLEWAFDGVSGPRAADPGRTIEAWEQLRAGGSGVVPTEDLRITAERLGYGLVLTGSIRSTRSTLHVGARLQRASDGLLIAEVDTLGSADPDSAIRMVQEVATRLVGAFGGQPPDRASGLMGTSTDARRAYLEAQRLLRQGKWDEAVLQFELALGRDSSFALAALGLNTALIWTSPASIGYAEALALAWKHRDQLAPIDRAIVEARGGGPEGLYMSKQSDELAVWERLTSQAPDRFDVWFGLADDLFHYGALLGAERPIERAWDAFVRAYETDSTMVAWDRRRAELLMHLVDVALFRRDTAGLNRYLPEFLASDAALGKYAHDLQGSVLQGDAVRHDSLLRFMDPEDSGLWVLPLEASEFGFALPEADKAATLLSRDPEENAGILWRYSLIRGRPSAALRFGEGGADHFLVRDALYGDGDRAAAAFAVARISSGVDSGPPESESTRGVYWSNLCALLQWRLAAGDTSGVAAGVRSLRSVAPPVDQPLWMARAHACAEVLNTWLAVERQDPRALALLDSLDATLRHSPRLSWGRAEALNSATARLWERMGRPERALAAIRRRNVGVGWHMYLAAMLREEGRLAALVGDRQGAIDAYVKYLELRSDPESVLEDDVAAVRRELVQLRPDPPGG